MRTPALSRSLRALAALAVLTLLAGLAVATASTAEAVGRGFRMVSGQSLSSPANGYRLAMQTDGNLVLYTNHGVPVWFTGTAGRGSSAVVLQTDGNLVVYTAAGSPTWSSRTSTATTFTVGSDGNLVLADGSGRTVWCSCSLGLQRVVGTPSALSTGQGLLAGDALVAGNRRLTLQTDGNLVLYGPSGAAWSTRTSGGLRSKLVLQNDGNLVVIGSDGRPKWDAHTGGTGARSLRVGTDGSVVLVTASGTVVWRAGSGATTPTGIAGDVFALLNRQRAAHGLPALTSDPRLVTSGARHNAAMSAADTLAHQLPGEADPGARITAAGYTWRAWAENIAWTTNATSAGAQALQTAMYNEVAPNDGHRQNILSSAVTQVGVAVLVDSRGKLWLTTDFGAPR